jgi:uncharacterized protein YecE (DUF72 family)
MRVYCGTSGFSFKEWRGSFYPEDLSPSAFLGYYASRLSAVEVNATFYRIPKEQTLTSWCEQVPDDFRFALKASRRITHYLRLRGCEELLEVMLTRMLGLGEKLGAVLFQFPPDFRLDLPLLEQFLRQLPRTGRYAFEFRHPSWFVDDVRDALVARGAALCAAEEQALVLLGAGAGSWGYLRLRDETAWDDNQLRELAATIGAFGWEQAYIYFKHEDGAVGPRLARSLLDILQGDKRT